ncbi:MAG: glycerate kinase [Chitinophagales bacterium]
MYQFIVAPDSFKGSLTASQAAARISEGIKWVLPEARVIEIPMSDGGDGLVDVLVTSMGCRRFWTEVTGPLGNRILAEYGILNDNKTAVIEMSAASGLTLVPREKRDPFITTSRGTGDLIVAALDRGCRRFIIGIGGSSTSDGGVGMAQALGVKFLAGDGREILPGARGLLQIKTMDVSEIDKRVRQSEFTVACDVDNPLCGPSGAAYVYARQKGASPKDLPLLDQALMNMADVVQKQLQFSFQDLRGAGAAGGLGAGLAAFTGAKLCRGVEVVFDLLDFDNILSQGADLVITGEGEIDYQSLFGKVPLGVARRAKKFNIPVMAIVGSIGPGAEQAYEAGIEAIMDIIPRPMSLDEALLQAGDLLAAAASRMVRIMLLSQKRQQIEKKKRGR